MDNEIIPFLEAYGYDPKHLYFNYPYLGMVTAADALQQLDGSPFMNREKVKKIKTGDIYVWDHWFSIVEGNISKEYLLQNGFEEVHCDGDEYWKWTFEFCVFRKMIGSNEAL